MFDETYYVKDAYSIWHLGYEGTWAQNANASFVRGNFSMLSPEASFVVHPPRDFPDATAVFPHPGEEFLLVLKGAIEVHVGERQFRLETGDSVYFDSELPHRMRTVSRAMAEVLVVAAH